MKRTRLSLTYLATYLLIGGIGLLLAPKIALSLLLATGDYGRIFPQIVGMFMIGLAIVVVQIIRFNVAVLYPTTLAVRAFFLVCLAVFYFVTLDPLFLVLIAIVGFGFVLTGWSYLTDRQTAGT